MVAPARTIVVEEWSQPTIAFFYTLGVLMYIDKNGKQISYKKTFDEQLMG